MKKTIIAGAASVVLAAMPVVGVFAADDEVVDNLTVSIEESCTISRTEGTGDYSKELAQDALDENFGKTTLTVICNNFKGYKVTAGFTGLNVTGGDSITFVSTAPTKGSGTWAAYDGSAYITEGGTVMSGSGATSGTGETKEITYKVSTKPNQGAGTYTGKATYTLSQNS